MQATLALLFALAAFLPLVGAAAMPSQARTSSPSRPDIIVIQTDDQGAASVRVMPNVRRLLGEEGATFEQALAAIPLESPALATLLSGRYAHGHGPLDERSSPRDLGSAGGFDLLPSWLGQAGYYTAYVGRYLAGYGAREPRAIPAGWDEWYVPVGGFIHRYLGYALNENGALVRYGTGDDAYLTDVLAAKAAAVVARRAAFPQPLFLWVSFLAPRAGLPSAGRLPETPLPATRHQGRFASEALPLPPSFNEHDVSDKPAWVQRRPLLGPGEIARVTQTYRLRLESLLAVDEGVASILSALATAGRLDRAWIVFTSLTGFLSGEHRIPRGKGVPYEEATRVPLLVRGPGVVGGLRLSQPVSAVDLAPSLLDMAGLPPRKGLDGRSLLPLLADPGLRYGRDLLVEGPVRDGPAPAFAALRTPRLAYVEYATGERELYDLARDPSELRSLHADPARAPLVEAFSRRLERLRRCSGSACLVGPALSLFARAVGPCSSLLARATLGGPDARWLRRVAFFLSGRRVAVDSQPPFQVVTRLPAQGGRVRALALLLDGREVTRDRELPPCLGRR